MPPSRVGLAGANPAPTEPLRVLIVEDEATDARLVQRMLKTDKDGSFDVKHVEKLAAAIERLRSGWAQLLLLDLSLPDSWGMPTVTRARSAAPTVPIIVLTGVADMELAGAAFHKGAQDYLIKDGLTAEILLRAVRYAVERASLQASLRDRDSELHALLEAMPAAVFRLRRDGSVVFLETDRPGAAHERAVADAVPDLADVLLACLPQVLDLGQRVTVQGAATPSSPPRAAYVARRGPDEAVVVVLQDEAVPRRTT
jgi:CheY-like chemotaxis protein